MNEEYVLNNWRKDDYIENVYFHKLNNGHTIGYDADTECFCLDNLWNEISIEDVENLLKNF